MNPNHKGIVKIIHGNEACVEGAILAGCRFFAGYPITPASEVLEIMATRMPRVNGVFMQMEDELASINAVIGAAWGGMKAMTATSGPGFSLMQEGIGYAAETETPCVILDVMRGGPSTGQPTLSSQQDVYQAKYGSHGDYEIIVLTPSSAQEALDMTIRAFNLAEQFLVPVIILTDEVVGHTRERVVIPDVYETINRKKPLPGQEYIPFKPEEDGIPLRADFGEGYNILVDGQLHDEYGNRVGHIPSKSAALVQRLCDKINKNRSSLKDIEMRNVEDAELVIVSYGSTARPALRAMIDAREAGMKVGWVKIRTLFPFPEEELATLAKKVYTFIVPEMNVGKIVNEVERVTKRHVLSLPKVGGDLHTPEEIINMIKEVV
ncbi:MAG: 2-oxoacid:acceptor oxidoreductase subunit alpha [Desulfitobacteriaceae bacterium]